MTATVQHFHIPSLATLGRFTDALAATLRAGDVVLLHGTLGAGKTELCRSLIRALPIEQSGATKPQEVVPSPTFTLVQSYERALGTVHHFDLYRLGSTDELYELGWEESLSGGLTLVEWPDRLAELTPPAPITLRIDLDGDVRLITITSARPLELPPLVQPELEQPELERSDAV